MSRTLSRIHAGVDTAFFRPVPADGCALLRIGLGVVGLMSLAGLTPVAMHWSVDGVVPGGSGGIGLRSLLRQSGLGDVAGWTLWVSLIGAFVLLTIGFNSRLATAACLLGSIVQAHWNRLPLSMAWQVEVSLLFCLLFANSGGALSIDAWRQRTRPTVQIDDVTPLWPLFLMRYQIALIYFSSGLWKLVGTSWRDGSALHYVLSNHAFSRFPSLLTPAIEWLATLATYLTVSWEIAFPVLVLHRLGRRIALAIGIAIHLGITATIEVGTFSLVMLVSYIAFLDQSRVAEVTRRIRRAHDDGLKSPLEATSRMSVSPGNNQ